MAKLTQGVVEIAIKTPNNQMVRLDGYSRLNSIEKFKYLNTDNAKTFAEVYNDNELVHYVLEQHTPTGVSYCERGIGYVCLTDKDAYLIRDNVICDGDPNDLRPTGNKLPHIPESKDSVLIASTYYPVSYLEALLSPHCVLISTEKGPQLLEIPQNHILGRLDGDIEAIDINSLAELLGDVLAKGSTSAPMNYYEEEARLQENEVTSENT